MANSYGLQYIVFRMGTTYGDYTPREKAIYQWVRNLLIGEPIILNGQYGKDNSPSMDWVHIYDAGMAVNSAVMVDWNNNNKNEIYNIGGCLGEQVI
jgi:dTDP-D-glucose 4,6-dehydratase